LRGKSIFDELHERGTAYYVGDQDSEEIQMAKVSQYILNKSINFAYLLFGKLDALMHKHGPHHSSIQDLLNNYAHKIREILKLAEGNYGEVDLFLFSDHGMHEVTGAYDLANKIEKLGVEYGVDYIAFYDSTMARFWFLNEKGRKAIVSYLNSDTHGRLLSDQDLQELGVYFPDKTYGEAIFLMNSAEIIVPSYMGLKPVKGMHGFHPNDDDSKAMIMSNRSLPEEMRSIKDISKLVFQPTLKPSSV
jgi:predicted AlkP superfamily pyrophosphatase or phosphodiesterase